MKTFYTALFTIIFGSTYISSQALPTQSPTATEAYLEQIANYEFEAALQTADAMLTDAANCKASARFWLGTVAFADGDLQRAEQYFADGLALQESGGRAKYWLSHAIGKTGWSQPAEMLSFIKRSQQLPAINPRYVQKIAYVMVQKLDAPTGENGSGPRISMEMTPGQQKHGMLSLNILRRYLQLFSNGQVDLQISSYPIDRTARKVDNRNIVTLSSLEPWDLEPSLLMNSAIADNDLLFIAFPRKGGNAIATIGAFSLLPGIISSPTRTGMYIPSGWLTMINFPQIFHEYMHTVEYAMVWAGMKEFHATSHGNDEERVEALTHIPTAKTGETDWAEYFFARTIPEFAAELETKNHNNGYEYIFGLSSKHKHSLPSSAMQRLYERLQRHGSKSLLEARDNAEKLMTSAYSAYNKDQKPALAASRALEAFKTFPYNSGYYGKTKWFVENSKLKKAELETMLAQLNEEASQAGIVTNVRDIQIGNH